MSVTCFTTGQLLVTVQVNLWGRATTNQDIRDWLAEQGWEERDRWFYGNSHSIGYHLDAWDWHFRSKDDAMMFKLAWA